MILLPDFLYSAMAAEAKKQLANEVLMQALGIKLPTPQAHAEQPRATDKDIEDIRRYIARQERR